MGLYSAGLIIGRIFGIEIRWEGGGEGAYFREGLFFGEGLLSEFQVRYVCYSVWLLVRLRP